jgi:hypothetical protein
VEKDPSKSKEKKEIEHEEKSFEEDVLDTDRFGNAMQLFSGGLQNLNFGGLDAY